MSRLPEKQTTIFIGSELYNIVMASKLTWYVSFFSLSQIPRLINLKGGELFLFHSFGDFSAWLFDPVAAEYVRAEICGRGFFTSWRPERGLCKIVVKGSHLVT